MQIMPSHMIDFIGNNHVVSLAAYTDEDFWAANCFYAFDALHARLIILTAQKTRHARLMAENPHIVGTICTQTETYSEIEGIQFSAVAACLEEKTARDAALRLYCRRHPIARLKSSDVWELRLETAKHTDNKVIFAQKTLWTRET